MIHQLNRRTLLVAATAFAAARPALGQTTHEVQMLNRDPDNPRQRMVYLPRVLMVQPGDTVKWLSVDPGHNAASKEGMIPEGVEPWESRINDDFELTFDQPGIYGYACTPHETVGMVGLVIVEGEGMLDNLEAAQEVRQRGRARNAWEEIWAEVDEMGLTA
ncbi:MAG: pseudoazurin [Pseudomonadota bacterium]